MIKVNQNVNMKTGMCNSHHISIITFISYPLLNFILSFSFVLPFFPFFFHLFVSLVFVNIVHLAANEVGKPELLM